MHTDRKRQRQRQTEIERDKDREIQNTLPSVGREVYDKVLGQLTRSGGETGVNSDMPGMGTVASHPRAHTAASLLELASSSYCRNPPPPIVASAAQEIATACHLEAEGLLYVPGLKFGVEETNPGLMTLSDHTQSATKPLQKKKPFYYTDR